MVLTLKRFVSAICVALLMPSPALSEEVEKRNLDPISVCLGDQLLSVPLVPGLQIIQSDGSLRDFRSLHRMSDALIQGIYDRLPLKAKTVVLNSPYPNQPQPPLLETMLGLKSPYRVRQIKLYAGVWADFDTWMGTHPAKRKLPSGTELFVPKIARFANRPIKVACHSGLPPSSDDPNKRYCTVLAFSRRKSTISISFNTAIDLDGHWPTAPDDWQKLDMSSWTAPLSEVERAIQEMRDVGAGREICH